MVKYDVGILINSKQYLGIPTGKTQHEVLDYYEQAGKMYQITPCYFRLQDIRHHGESVVAYVKYKQTYIRKKIPMPQVIHNRAIYSKPQLKRQIDTLVQQGKQVFNHWNRYGKLQIYEILMQNMELRPHLPCTVKATEGSIQMLMKMYDELILKPNKGSIGRGIAKLNRTNSGWKLVYPIDGSGRSWQSKPFRQQLPLLLKQRIRSRTYVIQQCLPLATYHQRPFDLRVSVQKNHLGSWQITGIVGKVAAPHKFITNVAQGGTVHTLPQLMAALPHLDSSLVQANIEQFSLRAARQLSTALPHLADIGLDIGITHHGFPVFIECNNRDLRYSFQKGKLFDEWKATYSNPIGYAHYLLKNKPVQVLDK